MSRRGYFLFIALAVVWGIPYFFIKIVVEEATPAQMVFLRCGMAALIMLPLAWRDGSLVLALRKWKYVLAFAAFEFIGPWYLLAAAEQRISSSLTGLLLATIPLFSTPLGRFLGDRSATEWQRLMGLAVGFAGVGLLVGIDGVNGDIDYVAVFMMLLTSAGYAIAPQISSRKMPEVSTMGVVGLGMPMVTAFYAIPALTSWPAAGISAKSWAIALGVAAAGDKITAGMFLGFPLVLLGSYFAARPPKSANAVAVQES